MGTIVRLSETFIISARMLIFVINPYIPEFLKWSLPLPNLVSTIVPNTDLNQKLKQPSWHSLKIYSGPLSAR